MVLTCKVDAATGIPLNGGCHDVGKEYVIPADSSIVSCVDAASGHFAFQSTTGGAPKGVDLIVACESMSASALFRIDTANGNKVTKLVKGLAPHTALLRVGDVNGDGVDDVVVIHGNPGAQTLTVLQQCTTRDAACKEAP